MKARQDREKVSEQFISKLSAELSGPTLPTESGPAYRNPETSFLHIARSAYYSKGRNAI